MDTDQAEIKKKEEVTIGVMGKIEIEAEQMKQEVEAEAEINVVAKDTMGIEPQARKILIQMIRRMFGAKGHRIIKSRIKMIIKMKIIKLENIRAMTMIEEKVKDKGAIMEIVKGEEKIGNMISKRAIVINKKQRLTKIQILDCIIKTILNFFKKSLKEKVLPLNLKLIYF